MLVFFYFVKTFRVLPGKAFLVALFNKQSLSPIL